MRINLIELDKTEDLISISEQDLDSSDILLNSGKYPNSVWLFLQSVEKSTKAQVLMNEIMKFKDLKPKMGHDPFKMYDSNLTKGLQNAKSIEEAKKKFPEIDNIPAMGNLNLKDYIKKAEEAKEILSIVKNKEKILSDDLIVLDSLIKQMRDLIDDTKKSNMEELNQSRYEEYKKAWTTSILAFIELSKKQGKHISKEEQDEALLISDDTLKLIADNTRKNLILLGLTQSLNTVLNMLIAPHFEFLRYPETKNPIKYYNENNPLIKRMTELIKIQRDNLNYHKEYLDILKKDRSRIVIEED